MKLATYSDGSRDGQLVVVSRDLRHAHYATHVAGRLQQVLDDWNFLSPQLQDIYDSLNSGRAPHAFAFDPARCMAPLPRAYQCVQADPWLPEALTPQLEQAVSDPLHAAHAGLLLPSERAQGDLAVGLAVVTGDLPQGASSDQALAGIRLLMLCSQLRWQGVDDAALAQPFTAFSPVAVTPDELEFFGATPSTFRQKKYLCNMASRGFGRHTVFIHEDDRDELMALINERKQQRLKQLLQDEQVWQ